MSTENQSQVLGWWWVDKIVLNEGRGEQQHGAGWPRDKGDNDDIDSKNYK